MTAVLSMFGAPTIRIGGAAHALPFERRAQVLVYLALKRAWIARAELAALLWPEQESRLAQTNLRKALFRLQGLPWADHLHTDGSALRADIATDVAAFESALKEGRLEEALAMRRGELLAGFEDDANEGWSSWLGFERERLRVAWRGAAHELLSRAGEPRDALALASRLVDDDPLDEGALGLYMTWLARAGQSAHARQVYRDFAARLGAELGLEPGAELRALHDSLGAVGQPSVGSAPVADDDTFVGRTVELRRITALLAEESCRLLTVLGPGGVGKTRLVRRLIEHGQPTFPDGAIFIPLEDLTLPADFVGRLAHEFDVQLKGRIDPLDAVIAVLRGRWTLIVLDNFEQLLDAAPLLDRVLEQCPGVKAVVTSRVRLSRASEWLFPLDGLPCPDEEDRDRLESFDAARLFVRAARRVAPGLVPAAESQAIVDICRQVEGLPLALELAAAWARVLPCEAIAAELKRGTELLQAVDTSHPARHASIEFVFEQSWRLLTPIERDVLARLSVFRGGFTAEAARAVAGAPLPVLGALADKSLLRKEGVRLLLHPLVQQLAAARLEGAPRADAQAAHAAYFLRLLTQRRAAIGASDRAALQAVEDDFDNCRAAWSWAISRPKCADAPRSARALLDFCDYRNRFAEGLALFAAATESPLAHEDSSFRALTLSQHAHLLYRLDRYPEAEAEALRALQQSQKSDHETQRQAFNVLATCALRHGRLADARDYFQQALEATPVETHAAVLAKTLDHLALVEKGMGHYDEALRLALQALTHHRRLGDPAAEALCLSNLGSLLVARHEYAAAGEYLRPALEICERENLVSRVQYVLANLTEAAMYSGDLVGAQAYAERALEAAASSDHRAMVATARLNLARIAVRRGHLDAARAALAEATTVLAALGIPGLKFDALVGFAEVLQAQGHAGCARQVLAFAAAHPSAIPGVRTELQRLHAEIKADGDAGRPWPGLNLDDLLHRIVAETGLAYAPLIVTLQGA